MRARAKNPRKPHEMTRAEKAWELFPYFVQGFENRRYEAFTLRVGKVRYTPDFSGTGRDRPGGLFRDQAERAPVGLYAGRKGQAADVRGSVSGICVQWCAAGRKRSSAGTSKPSATRND